MTIVQIRCFLDEFFSVWSRTHGVLCWFTILQQVGLLENMVRPVQHALKSLVQIWLIPIANERVGVQVKLWDPLRTRAIPERFWGGVHEEALYQVYVLLPL